MTVIPEDMWNELGSVPLQESHAITTLKSYLGHAVPAVGEATVHVQYHAQEVNLLIIVTKRIRLCSRPHGKRLVVKNQVGMDWYKINDIQQTNPPKLKLEDTVQQYLKLFDGKLGTI